MKIKSHKTSVIIWQNFCVEKNINERTLGCGWEVSDFEIRHGFSLINIMLNIIPFDNVRIKDFNVIKTEMTIGMLQSIFTKAKFSSNDN